MKKYYLILSFLFFAISCKENSTIIKTDDYLVFGHFYGECLGEQCIEIFRLANSKLYEDTLDNYPSYSGFYKGNFVSLSSVKYNSVKDLWDYFPNELLAEKDTVFGCPDCRDQGGLYIEYSRGSSHRFMLFDNDTNKIPQKYHTFLNNVKAKIKLLQ